VNIPTLVAAGVLVLVWLAGMVVALCRKTVARNPSLSRVAAKLSGRRRSRRDSDAAGGDKGAGDDAAGATMTEEEATPRANGKAPSSPRSSRIIEAMDI
jgi:hypothetical protein